MGMHTQRIQVLIKMEIRKMIREPALLFMILLLPAIMAAVFGLAFGVGGDGGETSFTVALITLDDSEYPGRDYFIGNLTDIDILEIYKYESNTTAQDDLSQGRIHSVLIIPENFGLSLDAYWKHPMDPSQWINITIPLYVDGGSQIAMQAIPPLINQALSTTMHGDQVSSYATPISLNNPQGVDARKYSAFDFMAPGLFTYGAIFLTLAVAMSFTAEREEGILRRLYITPMTSSDLMTSLVISHMILALIQSFLILATSLAIGYRPVGVFGGLLMTFLIMIVFSLCCVGLGLIVVAIAKSSNTAVGISFVFVLPQMMLGTFVTTGSSPVLNTLSKLVPAHYATDAITSLLLRGANPFSETIVIDFLVIFAISIVVLVLGIFAYEKYGKD